MYITIYCGYILLFSADKIELLYHSKGYGLFMYVIMASGTGDSYVLQGWYDTIFIVWP